MRTVTLNDSDICLVVTNEGKGKVFMPLRNFTYKQGLYLIMCFEKMATDFEEYLKMLYDPSAVDEDLAKFESYYFGGE